MPRSKEEGDPEERDPEREDELKRYCSSIKVQ